MNPQHATAATLESLSRHHANATLEAALPPLSLVVPVFNESEGIERLMEMLDQLQSSYCDPSALQIVLVDDGSSDGSAEVLKQAAARRENYRVVEHSRNLGIAAAIYTGLLHADHEIVVSIDADGSYDAALISETVPLFKDHIDLLTASPYHPRGRVENVPAWRLLLSQCASQLYRLAMRRKLYCYTSCFRFYRRSRFVEMPPKFAGFIGVAELIWRADRLGLGIEEFPATLRTRQVGKSKMKIARASLQHLCLLGRISADRLTRGRFFSPK